MAKSKDLYTDEPIEEQPIATEAEVPPPECPEGMDEAIWAQGLGEKAQGKKETDCPFAQGSHQAESWLAGFAAGVAPEPPAEPVEAS
jgi:hypothetical protein